MRDETSSILVAAHEAYDKREHVTVAEDIGHLGMETEASKHHRDTVNIENTPEAEIIARDTVNFRKETSKSLTEAHEAFDNRDHLTVVDNLGHFGAATEASKHHHDSIASDNTPAAEIIARDRVNFRKGASKALTEAHEAYNKRDRVTIAEDIGNLGAATEASKHHNDSSDSAPSAEITARDQVNFRKGASKSLTEAREAYDKRDRVTVAEDIGHLGTETQASKHHHDSSLSNTPSAELTAKDQANFRKGASKSLTEAREAYDKRDHATVAENVGHLGIETEVSKHRQDSITIENTPTAEIIARSRTSFRKAASKSLTEAREAYDKRDLVTVAEDVGHVGLTTEASRSSFLV